MKLAIALAAATVLLSSQTHATDVGDVLLRAGLDAEALAAAGLASGSVASVVDEVDEHLAANPNDLTTADQDHATASTEVDRLRRLVRGGKATAQDVADLAAAKQDLADAADARDAALDAIFAAGTADLAASVADTLATIRANRSWGVPVEFLSKDRADADWIALRDALTNEKIAAAEGTAVDAACASLLLAERADPAVSAAKTAHDANFAAVEAAWTTAVGGS